MTDDQLLTNLQRDTFEYFLKEAHPQTGLIRDRTGVDSPSSIAATGLGLACFPIGVERAFISRDRAIDRVLTTLNFFRASKQGPQTNATGYKGFYYHFLDMETGERALKCELSTLDTAWLLAGLLTVATYFDRGTDAEGRIRSISEELIERVDWRWALNGGETITHGWRPERGFIRYRYEGYHEGIIMYLMALGTSRHRIAAEGYRRMTAGYRWKRIYGHDFVYAGPMFVHQWSHMWIDFRGIQDDYMRQRGIDYFENSRRATLVQQGYATRNPKRFAGYAEHCFGLSASHGPGPTQPLGGHRRYFEYRARGVPFGPDDGTIAPSATLASLPFAPAIVLPTIRKFSELCPGPEKPHGFRAPFNPSYPSDGDHDLGWISPVQFGLDEGPIMVMTENYRSGFIWELMKGCRMLVEGLRRAGFRGGWLNETKDHSGPLVRATAER